MDLIDKRDEVLRTFLEYGITDCEWCDLKKTDLADCAESIVKKLIIPDVVKSSCDKLSHNSDIIMGGRCTKCFGLNEIY